eukprot:scaffold4901_cov50-Cyclotella_meneghiniana.AAC.3
MDGVTFDGVETEATPLRDKKKEDLSCLKAVLITPAIVFNVEGNSNCLIVRSNCLSVCNENNALGGQLDKLCIGISRGWQQVCVRIEQIGRSPGHKIYFKEWSREKRAARQSTVVSAASALFSHDQYSGGASLFWQKIACQFLCSVAGRVGCGVWRLPARDVYPLRKSNPTYGST